MTVGITFDLLVKDVGVGSETAALLANLEGLLGTVSTSALNGADWDYTWSGLQVGTSFGRSQQKSGLDQILEDLAAFVDSQAPGLDLDVTLTYPAA